MKTDVGISSQPLCCEGLALVATRISCQCRLPDLEEIILNHSDDTSGLCHHRFLRFRLFSFPGAVVLASGKNMDLVGAIIVLLGKGRVDSVSLMFVGRRGQPRQSCRLGAVPGFGDRVRSAGIHEDAGTRP